MDNKERLLYLEIALLFRQQQITDKDAITRKTS